MLDLDILESGLIQFQVEIPEYRRQGHVYLGHGKMLT